MSETLVFDDTPSGTPGTGTGSYTPSVGSYSNGSLGGLTLSTLSPRTWRANNGTSYTGSGVNLVPAATCNADRRCLLTFTEVDGSDEYLNWIVHAIDASNYIEVQARNHSSFSPANLRLMKVVAGAATQIDGISWGPLDGTTIAFEYIRAGDAVSLKADGSTVLGGTLGGALTGAGGASVFLRGSIAGSTAGSVEHSFHVRNLQMYSTDAVGSTPLRPWFF